MVVLYLPKNFDFKTKKVTPGFTAGIRRIISRCLIGRLKSSEYLVLMFIIDRTLDFGKWEEIISYPHIVHGVPNKDRTEYVVPGVGIGRSTAIRAVKALLDEGIITRKEDHRTQYGSMYYKYKINVKYFSKLVKEIKMEEKRGKAKLRGSRKSKLDLDNKLSSEGKQGVSKVNPGECHSGTIKDTNIINNISNNKSKGNIVERSAPQNKFNEITTKKDFINAFEYYCKELHGVKPSWVKEVLFNIRKCILPALEKANIDDVEDFLHFINYRWCQITKRHFGWMQESPPPARPDPRFFFKWREKFIESYLNKKELWAFVEGEDINNEITRKIRSGVDPELAHEIALKAHQDSKHSMSNEKISKREKASLKRQLEQSEKMNQLLKEEKELESKILKRKLIEMQKEIEHLRLNQDDGFDEDTKARLQKRLEEENGN